MSVTEHRVNPLDAAEKGSCSRRMMKHCYRCAIAFITHRKWKFGTALFARKWLPWMGAESLRDLQSSNQFVNHDSGSSFSLLVPGLP